MTQKTALLGLVFFGGVASLHAEVNVPNQFSAGETARASEVNANFSALETGVNQALGQLETVNNIPSTGDAAADGQNLRDAVEAVGTGGGPAVIQLGAGTYDIGNSTLAIDGHVVIAGAGRGATTITGTAPGGEYRFDGGGSFIHVFGGGTLEIRDLELDPLSLNEDTLKGYAAALSVRDSGSKARVTNVHGALEISDTASTSVIAYTFFVAEDATLQFVHSRADVPVDASSATNDRLDGLGASAGSQGGANAQVENSDVDGVTSGGSGTVVEVRGSAIAAASDGNAVRAVNSGTLYVAASKVDGNATDSGGGGTLTCVHVYDASYASLGTGCQ